MGLKFNWQRVTDTHSQLRRNGTKAETPLIFVLVLQDGTTKRQQVLFRDFMDFFWSLSENNKLPAQTLFVQDAAGKIVYRHNQMTKGNEEVPTGGNPQIITNWNSFSAEERETYLKLLWSQINADGK